MTAAAAGSGQLWHSVRETAEYRERTVVVLSERDSRMQIAERDSRDTERGWEIYIYIYGMHICCHTITVV